MLVMVWTKEARAGAGDAYTYYRKIATKVQVE